MTNDINAITPADEILAEIENPLAAALTPKQREVVDYLIRSGERPARAAEATGTSPGYISRLLTQPKVRAYYDAELEARRVSHRARREHFMEKTIDKAMEPGATAAVMRVGLEVVKHIDGSGDSARAPQVNIAIAVPGYVINLTPPSEDGTIGLQLDPPKSVPVDRHRSGG